MINNNPISKNIANSINDMQSSFINLAVSQVLNNPFLISSITNSVISNISYSGVFKISSKTI